jgi:site-specific recombinase XerD
VQRNRSMLSILLDCGLRASELLSLQLGDVDPQAGLFEVVGKGSKTRTVAIGNFARRELWAYLRARVRE